MTEPSGGWRPGGQACEQAGGPGLAGPLSGLGEGVGRVACFQGVEIQKVPLLSSFF